jgi:hypothetical protein
MRMLVQLTSKLALGCNQPCVECVPGVVSPDVKWAECEADHSIPSSAQVQNE